MFGQHVWLFLWAILLLSGPFVNAVCLEMQVGWTLCLHT